MLPKIIQKNINYILLGLLVILGAFFRVQGVLTGSFAFTYDVGRDMLALWDITHFVDLPFIGPTTGLPGVFYGPWWYYLLSPFFFIFGGDPSGIALVMGVVGVASIIAGYILCRKIGGEFMALSFAAVASVSPVMISLASQIWNPNIAPIFVLLTFLVLYQIYTHKRVGVIFYFFLGLLLTLSTDIEVVFGILFSGGIILSLIVIRGFKFTLREILFFMTGVLIILSPRILFEVKNHFLMTKSFFMYFGAPTSGTANIFTSIPDRFNIFLGEFSGTLTHGDKTIGLILLAFIFFIILSLYKYATSIQKGFIKSGGIIILVFFIGTSLFSHDIWPHYLVGLPVIYILLFVVALSLLKDKTRSSVVPITLVLAIFFLNFNPIAFINDLKKPLWEGDAAVYRNQMAVIDYIYKEADGRDFKYVVYTPPVHDFTYKYLFKWYGPKKYGEAPVERSELAFFILEPDHEQPGRLKDWLVKREGDGVTVKSKVVKGGIIVQTRNRE